MFKKIIALAVAVMVIGVSFVPPVQAQDFTKMQQELLQVQQDLAAGKITEAQAAVRMNEINQKYLGGSGTVGGSSSDYSSSGSDEAQAQNWALRNQAMGQNQWQQSPQQSAAAFPPEGYKTGWPSASQFKQWNCPALRKPAGLDAAFCITEQGISIIIKNGTRATFDQLAKEIEAAKLQYEGTKSSTVYTRTLPAPASLSGGRYRVQVELLEGEVRVDTVSSSG